MKKIALLILPVLILACCCPEVTVTVTNGTDSDRLPEMVELCSEQISGALDLKDGESFIIRNEAGEEQAITSPEWSIHAAAGTSNYMFI